MGDDTLYYNEACARCGNPADIHKGPNDKPSGTPNCQWGDTDTCRHFVRCDPPRPAYGTAWWELSEKMRWNSSLSKPENLVNFSMAMNGKTISRVLPIVADEGMLLVFSDGSCLSFGYSGGEGDTVFYALTMVVK